MLFELEDYYHWTRCKGGDETTFRGYREINYKIRPEHRLGILCVDDGYPFSFTMPVTDCAELRAWASGSMPCFVFADWLEETLGDRIPPSILSLLREPCENAELVGVVT